MKKPRKSYFIPNSNHRSGAYAKKMAQHGVSFAVYFTALFHRGSRNPFVDRKVYISKLMTIFLRPLHETMKGVLRLYSTNLHIIVSVKIR